MNATEKMADLLDVACSTLVDELVPSLSKHDRYNVLMVANAMRIATRHVRSAHEHDAMTADAGLLDDHAIVKGIRDGHFDSDSAMRATLIANLRKQLVQQLATDNPRALDHLQHSPQAR